VPALGGHLGGPRLEALVASPIVRAVQVNPLLGAPVASPLLWVVRVHPAPCTGCLPLQFPPLTVDAEGECLHTLLPQDASLLALWPNMLSSERFCAGCQPIPCCGGPSVCPEGRSRCLVVKLVVRADACDLVCEEKLSPLKMSLLTVSTEKPYPLLVGTLVNFVLRRPLPARLSGLSESTLSLGRLSLACSFGLLGSTRALALGVCLCNFHLSWSTRKANASTPCCHKTPPCRPHGPICHWPRVFMPAASPSPAAAGPWCVLRAASVASPSSSLSMPTLATLLAKENRPSLRHLC
jgi:hypothetical protein